MKSRRTRCSRIIFNAFAALSGVVTAPRTADTVPTSVAPVYRAQDHIYAIGGQMNTVILTTPDLNSAAFVMDLSRAEIDTADIGPLFC
jgi:hypothetical protein